MFLRNLQWVIVSGIIMVPGLLFAQPPGGRGGPPGSPPTEMILQIFQQADANNDGSVTKAELAVAMQYLARMSRPDRGGPPPEQGNPPGEQRGPGGPPPHEAGEGEYGHQGPPPRPGQVLPEAIAESLNLNERQTRLLAALQSDVDKRLAAILTDEQEVQLQNARPLIGPGHGPGHVEGEQDERPAGPAQTAE